MPTNPPAPNSGQFQKGVSGNPAGRPRGARNRATVLAEQLLEGEAQSLVRQAIDRAMGGDVLALRLCLERILPVLRGRRIELELPVVEATHEEAARGIAAAVAATARAMADGDITPEEAMTAASLFELQRRAVETADLERRLARLEEDARQRDAAPGEGGVRSWNL
jgi:hypothetical protein